MSIDKLMESPATRFKVSVAVRKGAVAIQNKYGTMLDYVRQHEDIDMHMINKEIERRDYLLYRYVRMYSR